MGLVTSTEMFKKAYEGHYAIGAFNVNNMEIIQGITEAARWRRRRSFFRSPRRARVCQARVSREAGRGGAAGRAGERRGSADRAASGSRPEF